MRIELPEPCLVVLIGASGSGKSTFAAAHFLPTEMISSDFCRGARGRRPERPGRDRGRVRGAARDRGAAAARGRLTVVDATNVQREARAALMQVAREHDLFAVAIVLDLPEEVCVGAQRVAAGPATSARTSSGASAAAASARCGTCSARASGASLVAAPPRTSQRRDRARADVDRPAGGDRAVRHHRRRPRVLRRAGRAARSARLRRRRAPGGAAARCSSATSWIAGRASSPCCGW